MAHIQASSEPQPGYNERLFKGGVRARLHMARFLWVSEVLRKRKLKPESVLELGCFDGRAVEYLPEIPARYLGLDAGWEDALTLARARWAKHPHLEFRECQSAAQMNLQGEKFDLALALETLEHISPEELENYLAEIAKALKPSGVFLVTIPNEIGPVFAAKHVLKVLFIGNPEEYTPGEFVWQALGRTEKVRRREHKGFHYGRMISTLRKYFDVERIEGLPFGLLPPYLSFGMGVVCRRKSG